MSRDDFYDSLFSRAYSAYIERPHLNRLIARVAWGGDAKPCYESMGAVAEVPAGGTVVDCPCGSGPVFRMLSTGSDIDYVAADLSPAMLARARARAEASTLVTSTSQVTSRRGFTSSDRIPSVDSTRWRYAESPLIPAHRRDFGALVPEMERIFGAVGNDLKKRSPAVQGLLSMELAGFEPATSWLRSNAATN